jgi:hypothetical protein
MEQANSTAFKERYMESMKGYFQGVREQVEARIQNRNLDIEEYMAIRWHSSGIVPSLLLADFCRGTYLPDYVHNHPTFNSLRRAAGEHVICVNVCQISPLQIVATDIARISSPTIENRGRTVITWFV